MAYRSCWNIRNPMLTNLIVEKYQTRYKNMWNLHDEKKLNESTKVNLRRLIPTKTYLFFSLNEILPSSVHMLQVLLHISCKPGYPRQYCFQRGQSETASKHVPRNKG